MSTRSVNRWLTQDAFRAAVKAQRDAVLASAVGSAVDMARAAFAVLNSVMIDTNVSPAARVSAAKGSLEYLYRGREAADLATRVAEIEAQIENVRGPALLPAAREFPR